MSKNVVVKFIEKKLRKIHKGRKISLMKVGLCWKIVAHDVLDNVQYELVDKHSYDEVVKLNEITGHTARFGYNPNLGSIAFIGIPNPNFNFSFFREIDNKNTGVNKGELEFYEYKNDQIKTNTYYKVYGVYGLLDLKDIVKFEKIALVCDLSAHKK